jgi:hypothetical protein
MSQTTALLRNLNDLRDFVNRVLCEQNNFEIGAFPLVERFLLRGEKACGIYFCLHGPRAVKFSAIWETDRNTILFYGANGERFHRVRLVEAFRLEPELVRPATCAVA